MDPLGDRMKRQYEDRTRIMLPRRTYTILRVDGKAFHTFTRHLRKPWDTQVTNAMDAAAAALCQAAQGARFAFVQSDEISVLLTDFTKIDTDAWFDGNLQKIASVAASVATAAFNHAFTEQDESPSLAQFDARVFTIPETVEVENYFIWRQQDAVRNSIQGYAQSLFPHKELLGLNGPKLQEKVFAETGLNWNDLPIQQKRGRVVLKDGIPSATDWVQHWRIDAGQWRIDEEPPIFTQDREYLYSRIPKHEV